MSCLVCRPWSVVAALGLMGLVIIAGLVSVLMHVGSAFGVLDLMDVLHLFLVGFSVVMLAPLVMLVRWRWIFARLIYVVVSLFGILADIGGLSGDGRVEIGCFISSLVISA